MPKIATSAFQPAQSNPMIWAISGHRLVDTFRAVGSDFASRARIQVAHLAFDEAVAHLREQLAQQACDVVVASGSNGAYLRSHLAVPVVMVKVGGYDLMTALCNARALSSRIAVVLHRAVSPELRRFADRFGIALEFRSYETADDAFYRIQELAGLGIEVVVGAGMVASLAQQAGLAGVFLYSTDSVRDAMEDAIAIAVAQRDQKSRHTQLDSVVRHLSDGVVAIDMAGRITTLNPAAARMVGRPIDGALGAPLQRIFAGLEPGTVLTQGSTELGRVDELMGRSLVVDCVPLHDAGQQTGAVFTLHAPGPMENAVSRLRAHSHRRSRSARYTLDQLVAVSPQMQELVRRCDVLAKNSDATVLIQGESGSGKEVVAQGIHEASRRRQQPFVATNCGAFPQNLLETELFGYEEGSFTGARRHGKAGLFETANSGTLFLDEIGEMPLLLQTRLLRVLQEKEITRVGGVDTIPVDVRIVAATHRDLSAMVRLGSFREDLFYRIHILQVVLPPLRDRPQDVQALAAGLVPAALERAGMGHLAPQVLRTAMPALQKHNWPGNVRELENVAERIAMACLMAQAAPALEEVVALLGYGALRIAATASPAAGSLTELRRQDENQRIQAALQAAGGDRDAAASALGISRTTLWRKLRT
ncbi:propionate catabolism operon regulatory protein PrpR [Polaromonas sp.]|uniref:propionate catabolism operon regulatory protein PrpR n=1 Tax=Polaromonas sp. TaxID=1869339 RepID=UPI001D593454|nr:propionate catabolism operon regulatory protein PrpR [Polaromonas sp.]MBT9474660.1 propionate catabolism operon regulatory protein PrpR [Polaromonas sp.]